MIVHICPKLMKLLSRQHNVVPELSLVSDVTHVALAFMQSSAFTTPGASDFPLFTSIDAARSQFPNGTAIMVAIGGWGDTQGFSVGAKTESSREIFAQNVKAMVEETGADGRFINLDIEETGITDRRLHRCGYRLGIPWVCRCLQ